MANEYGIVQANLGQDDNFCFLNDPTISIKEWGTTDSTFEVLSYCALGKSWKQKIDYAILETGIPKTEVRRDAVKQEITLEASLYQIQKEVLALVMQRKIKSTTDSYDGKTFHGLMIGEELPAVTYISIQIVGKTVDGNNFIIFIRKARLTSEDFEFAMGGDKDTEIKCKIILMPDGDPATNNIEWEYDTGNPTFDNIAYFAWETTAPA